MNMIGNVVVEESADEEAFIKLIEELDLRPPVIIKPNLGFSVCYTEATILDWALTVVDGDALVVESYGWARTKEALETGGWGSFEPEDLRESDRWFMEYSGIGKILEKHGVEFLNITEENWANRTADPETIRGVVEEKHAPLEEEDFLGIVPERLYEMRGCDLLSLAKVRILEAPMHVSLAVKNFFGMIPGPSRGKYHSLFNVKGVVEAVLTASLRDPETMKWENREDPGYASASQDLVELDAFVTALLGRDPNTVEYLRLAADAFGGWNEETVSCGLKSKMKIV
jgi:hypothetical protein